MKRDLTKANVSPFSGHSFHKRVTEGVGRGAPPSSTQRFCGNPVPGSTAKNSLGVTAKYNPSAALRRQLPLHRGALYGGYGGSATGPVVQSSQSALTVPSARFTPHLRVALHFVQVFRNLSRRTDH